MRSWSRIPHYLAKPRALHPQRKIPYNRAIVLVEPSQNVLEGAPLVPRGTPPPRSSTYSHLAHKLFTVASQRYLIASNSVNGPSEQARTHA